MSEKQEQEQKPLELEDTLADMIEFCLKMSDGRQSLLSGGIDPIKVRINKFRQVFEKKRGGPNNMKSMVSTAYSKCSKKIDGLDNDVSSFNEFLKWFGEQNIALQPRDDPKSVSIPLSIICRECLKMSEGDDDDKGDNENAALADIFLLHLLRIFAFATTSDRSEEKVDDHISYIEGILGLDPDETPDITGFLLNIMEKLSSRIGGKDMVGNIKKFMRGPLKREDRRKYEDIILKTTDKVFSAIPKDAMTNPENFDLNKVLTNTASDFQNDAGMQTLFNSLSSLGTQATAGSTSASTSTSISTSGLGSSELDAFASSV